MATNESDGSLVDVWNTYKKYLRNYLSFQSFLMKIPFYTSSSHSSITIYQLQLLFVFRYGLFLLYFHPSKSQVTSLKTGKRGKRRHCPGTLNGMVNFWYICSSQSKWEHFGSSLAFSAFKTSKKWRRRDTFTKICCALGLS